MASQSLTIDGTFKHLHFQKYPFLKNPDFFFIRDQIEEFVQTFKAHTKSPIHILKILNNHNKYNDTDI